MLRISETLSSCHISLHHIISTFTIETYNNQDLVNGELQVEYEDLFVDFWKLKTLPSVQVTTWRGLGKEISRGFGDWRSREGILRTALSGELETGRKSNFGKISRWVMKT